MAPSPTLPDGLLLANSYHVSRYNTSTRRLTPEMFEEAVRALLARLDARPTALTQARVSRDTVPAGRARPRARRQARAERQKGRR